jgi:4'-phosphopantetheinyl transferase EntD
MIFMPLFYSQTIDQHTRLAIWHIAEPLGFFLEKVPLSRQLTHPHKQLQHVAGRYLLQYLFPDFPLALIQIADTRKPYLPHESHHFSISHCGDYAAAIVSTRQRVGIDIEAPTERILTIIPKFLSAFEQEYLLPPEANAMLIATTCWSAKEALYKWYSLGQIDFRRHLMLQRIRPLNDKAGHIDAVFTRLDPPKPLTLQYQWWPNLILSFLAE